MGRPDGFPATRQRRRRAGRRRRPGRRPDDDQDRDREPVRDDGNEIRRVADAGADLVRVAVPRDKDVEALRQIVRDSPIPVIADIHFNHTLALKAIDVRRPLRPPRTRATSAAREKVAEVAARATEKGVPMRIGVNSGSLPKHLHALERENSVEALVAAGVEFVQLMERLDFTDFKVSIKSTNVPNTIAANRLLVRAHPLSRCISASPRPGPSGRARSRAPSAWARCSRTGSATRSASRSPPSTRRRRSRSPGRSSRRSSCASAAPC